MARISGYKCDAPKCSTTTEGPDLPVGWMTLGVRAVVAGRKDDPAAVERVDFHLCSNRCLKALSGERYKAAVARGDETSAYYARKEAAS